MMEINIPFSGFYESQWSSLLDHEAEQTAEYDATERQSEDGIPEPLRLDESVYHDAMYMACNWHNGYIAIAKDYVIAMDTLITDETGLELGLAFKDMTSPREYNFSTDRLFSDISRDSIARMFWFSRTLDKHDTLARIIKERFTSYDGFHSFYSNDVAAWLEKPLSEWDHNELGTLLCVPLSQCGDWEYYIYD